MHECAISVLCREYKDFFSAPSPLSIQSHTSLRRKWDERRRSNEVFFILSFSKQSATERRTGKEKRKNAKRNKTVVCRRDRRRLFRRRRSQYGHSYSARVTFRRPYHRKKARAGLGFGTTRLRRRWRRDDTDATRACNAGM